MSLNHRFLILLTLLILVSLACTAPALTATPLASLPATMAAPAETSPAVSASPEPALPVEPVSTATLAASLPDASPTPTLAETLTPITFPTVVFDRDTNCRLGPAKNYFTQTSFLKDRLTIAEGRNVDASWLWVQSLTPKTRCWISVGNLKNPEDFSFLPVIDLPSLPEAPAQVNVYSRDCKGRNKIVLRWSNVAGETGFHVYRDGITLALLKADAVEFVDYPPARSGYLYEVESINNFGLSVRVPVNAPGCVK
jgi:hypothetical protein